MHTSVNAKMHYVGHLYMNKLNIAGQKTKYEMPAYCAKA